MDGQGDVYVADRGNSRVLKLAPGSNAQTVLPFTGLKNPDGVAVDPAGNVYVTDTDNNRVLELAAGATAQTVLPFTGVSAPWGIAVDNAGTVYVTEHDANQVMKLVSGSNTPTVLPLAGSQHPPGGDGGRQWRRLRCRPRQRPGGQAGSVTPRNSSLCWPAGGRGIGGHGVEAGVARGRADHRDGVIAAADRQREVVLGEQLGADDLLPGVGEAGHQAAFVQQLNPFGGGLGGQRRLQFLGQLGVIDRPRALVDESLVVEQVGPADDLAQLGPVLGHIRADDQVAVGGLERIRRLGGEANSLALLGIWVRMAAWGLRSACSGGS